MGQIQTKEQEKDIVKSEDIIDDVPEGICEEVVDHMIEQSEKDLKKNSKEIIDDLKNSDKPDIKNESKQGGVDLGDLGTFDKVSNKDIDYVFDRLEGVVFQIQQCLFKISYMNKGQRKFTATLLNEN